MSSPFFSIIVPTFNAANTVVRCLESIVSQTYLNFEVLVVDGASSDKTISLTKDIATRTGKVIWTRGKDRGIYDAMNKGVCMAKGEWLYFLGSDDYFHDSEVLADVRSAIDSCPESKFVYGNVLTSAGYVQEFDHFSFDRLIEKNICHQAIFYHRSLFASSNYDYRLRLLADWDFNLRVYREPNHPMHIDRIIAVYNLEGASANWLNGNEYAINFSDKRGLYIQHKGLMSYYRYLIRFEAFKVKRAVWLCMNSVSKYFGS